MNRYESSTSTPVAIRSRTFRKVGGLLDVVSHRECDVWINDERRINGSPVNVRVSYWALNHSSLAKDGRAYEWKVLYGDWESPSRARRESTAVDPKLVDYFSSLELDRNAVADWTVRNVRFIVMDWPEMDRDLGDDGPGLGL
jgi:hypothetical protein